MNADLNALKQCSVEARVAVTVGSQAPQAQDESTRDENDTKHLQ